MEQVTGDILQVKYALDTFYFLVMGAFVMWMAAGFSMLEAGLVRSKNTAEILTKNIVLYSIASIMYMIVGYNIMYGDAISSIIPGISFGLGGDNAAAAVTGADGAPYYSNLSDFFFQVVFVATAMSIVSGAVAERMKLWAFFAFAIVFTGFIYPTIVMIEQHQDWLDIPPTNPKYQQHHAQKLHQLGHPVSICYQALQ